jgi:protein-disulfide isomerase
MNVSFQRVRGLLAGACLGAIALAGMQAAAEPDAEARKAKILANLKLEFPQLGELTVAMREIKPSGFTGLDAGSFTINGEQVQEYLVSSDDTKLYLVSGGPVDVSRSQAQIDEVLAQRAREELEKAATLNRELAEAIVGLPVRGNAAAPVTIVEFSDFQCPYCARASQTLDEVLASNEADVKLVFKHFPLGFHPWAKPAAIAAHCAGAQNDAAFWTLHDAYFKNQQTLTLENVIAQSTTYLEGSGIDMSAWSACAGDTTSEAHRAASAVVDADMALGTKLGVEGTPAFFVNGRFLSGAQPASAFKALIDQARAGS